MMTCEKNVYGQFCTTKYYHKMHSRPDLADSDGDGLDDPYDYAPLDAMSDDEKVVYDFFENAEDYEAAYLGDFCNSFHCSPRLAIEYIDTFRKYNTHDFGIDEIMQDLEDKGFECDKLQVEHYNLEYQNYKSGTSFAELMKRSYTSWADSIKFFMGIWAFGISAERCKSLSKWDYTGEYKLSLEEEKNAVKLINYKRDGVLRGSLNGLTKDEKTIINELLEEGKTVEIIPTESSPTADFYIDGMKTELKTLKNHNLNTPLSKIRYAFEYQKADFLIYDVRTANLTANDVKIIYNRLCGLYKEGLPGIIEFWTIEGKIPYYK